MENSSRRISVKPPDGDAVARYTVKTKPLDAFIRAIYSSFIPALLQAVIKTVICVAVVRILNIGTHHLSSFAGSLHEKARFPVYDWIFTLVILLFAAYEAIPVIMRFINARTGAQKRAASRLPEDYAFYPTALLYSNGRDLIRIDYKKIRLAFTLPIGMFIHAGSETDTIFIPKRYFCTEYPALEATLAAALKLRFIRIIKLGRDHEPMYADANEKIYLPALDDEPVGELKVKLQFADLGYLNAMWKRQIGDKHNKGVFGIICLFVCAVAFFLAAIVLGEAALVPVALVLLSVAILYACHITLVTFLGGRKYLVNRRDYKKPVRYIFHPAGFYVIYENGVSLVMYDDLELIFEDQEGLGLFFSKTQCMFIPNSYMQTRDGIRLSQFFKVSLFNLDATRGKKLKIE